MPACPSCGADEVRTIGHIPASNTFAGRECGHLMAGGDLMACSQCQLFFRWPRTAQAELEDLYRQGDPHAWTDEATSRTDWSIAADWLRERALPSISVLDVGCSTGGFLASGALSACRKYGIEMNALAAAEAREKGVEILGMDVFDFAVRNDPERKFEALVAFDLIEHTEDPLEFLRVCRNLIEPGGAVIIGTANTSAMSWAWAGARYWYCAIAEHLSFINESWCRIASGKLGLEIGRVARFSHGSRSPMRRLRECVANGLYLLAPGLFRQMRRRGFGGKDAGREPGLADYPPSWMSSKDHFVVEFVKPKG